MMMLEVAAALGRAMQAGLLSEGSSMRQLWRDLLRQYHWTTHMAAVSRALSKACAHGGTIATLGLATALQPRRQQQAHRRQRQQQQQEQRMLAEAAAGQCSELRAAAGALCAAVPNRFFCNNPACRSTAGVSAGFGLVRGEGVVCGGCLGLQLGDAVPLRVGGSKVLLCGLPAAALGMPQGVLPRHLVGMMLRSWSPGCSRQLVGMRRRPAAAQHPVLDAGRRA